MKTISHFCAALTLAASLAAPPCAPAQVSGNDLIRIEVRVQSSQDRKELKGTSTDTVTQHKALHITLSGKPKSPETRTAKWTAYGRDLKDHDIRVLESGEWKVDLSAGAQKFESKKISTTSTPEHAVVSGRGGSGGGNRRSRTSVKKIAAEGTKFIGYGVVVKDGAQVVGEFFDPPGLKKEAAK